MNYESLLLQKELDNAMLVEDWETYDKITEEINAKYNELNIDEIDYQLLYGIDEDEDL